MSAPITEAHLELAKTALFSRDAAGRLYTAPMTAQLIADSEAKAILEMETGRIKKLVHAFQTEKQERARAELERDQLKAEVGHLHGRVGLFAKAHFGINDNLLTDETFAQMSHALQTERAGLAIEEENANARAERAEAELAAERARLDYLSTRGFEHRHHETGDHLAYEWTISSTNELKDVSLREVIDAAMKEGAK